MSWYESVGAGARSIEGVMLQHEHEWRERRQRLLLRCRQPPPTAQLPVECPAHAAQQSVKILDGCGRIEAAPPTQLDRATQTTDPARPKSATRARQAVTELAQARRDADELRADRAQARSELAASRLEVARLSQELRQLRQKLKHRPKQVRSADPKVRDESYTTGAKLKLHLRAELLEQKNVALMAEIEHLRAENSAAKRELSMITPEFWEEVENLKYFVSESKRKGSSMIQRSHPTCAEAAT